MLGSINAGLIGYGYAGKTLHAPLLNATPGIRLRAIASSDGVKVRNDWPNVEHCPTPQSLIALTDLELVVIATPNDSHYPLAKAALLAGKHVVVDKPFTLTRAEALELTELARSRDRLLAVFHNRRWDADFLTLRKVIASGELGEIQQFDSHIDRYRPVVRERWREQALPGAGLWFDLGPHLLDQSLQLFGEPDSLWLDIATQRPGAQTDDFFHAVLHYGKKRVILHASTQVLDSGPRYQVLGSKGCYRKYGMDTQEAQLKAGLLPDAADFGIDPQPGLLLTASAATTEQLQSGDVPVRRQSVANLRGDYLAFYRGMVEAIQHDAPLPVLPEEAVQVMKWLELGLQSASEGRRISDSQGTTSRPAQAGTSQRTSFGDTLLTTPPVSPTASMAPAYGTPAPQPARPVPRPLDPSIRPSRTAYGEGAPRPATMPSRAPAQPQRTQSQPQRTQAQPARTATTTRQPLTQLLNTQQGQGDSLGPNAMGGMVTPRTTATPAPTPQASVPQTSTLGSGSVVAPGNHATSSPLTQAAAPARVITRTGETGSIRVDKPRGQSLSGKSTLPRQPATPELMPSRSHGHSNEPPRTAPRSAGLPFSHFERPPAIQEKHQADGSNEASRPLTPPHISALDNAESSTPLILPELSPSSLIASEKQAGRGDPLPRLSVDDNSADDEDDLPSFTAR